MVEQPQSPASTLTPARPFSRVPTSSVPQGFYQGTGMALLPSREPQGLCWALLLPARSSSSLHNSLSPCPCSAKALAGLPCLPESPRAFARIRKEPCISLEFSESFARTLLSSRFSWHLHQPLEGPGQCPSALQKAPEPSAGFAWARAVLAVHKGRFGKGLVHLVQ